MIKQIQGKILSVNPFKTGTSQKDGRSFNWTMFEVVIATEVQPMGEMFNTFDENYKTKVGVTGTWEVKEDTIEKNGRQYTRRTLEKLGKQSSNIELIETLGRIERRLEELLEIVSIKSPLKVKEDNQEIPF